MALTFGVSSTTGLTGPEQSFSTSTEADIDHGLDENGDTVAYNSRNESTVVSYEVLLDSTDTLTATGSTESIGGSNYIVESSEKTESNTDFQRGSITARKFETNTVPGA